MLIIESTAGPRKCRGLIDDSNRDFGVQSVVHPGSLIVKLNGCDQTEGIDYEVTWEIMGNITMAIAPSTGTPDVIALHYHRFGSVN